MNRFSAILAAVLIAAISPWAATRQCPDQAVTSTAADMNAKGPREVLLALGQGATVLDFQRLVAEDPGTEKEDRDHDREGDAEVWAVTSPGAKHSLSRAADESLSILGKLVHRLGQNNVAFVQGYPEALAHEGFSPPQRWRHVFHAGSNDPPRHTPFWERIVMGKTANAQQIKGTPIACHENHDCVVEESTT